MSNANTGLPRSPSRYHIKLARRLLILLPSDSKEIEQYQRHDAVILTKLTPLKILNGAFPATEKGTIYTHFYKTQKVEDIVVFVHRNIKHVADRVYYEAALGMQDNFAFH